MQASFETATFGCFTLDRRRRILLADGRPVALHARAFDLLAYLIDHREAAVSHADVLANVWEGRTVTDGNLSVQLSSLRKTLTESGCAEALILTLPGRRYQFVGEVRIDAPAAPTSPPAAPPPARDVAPADAAPMAVPTAAAHRTAALATPRRGGHTLFLFSAVSALCGMAALGIAWMAWPARPEPPRLSIAVLPFRNASTDRSFDYLADAVTDDLTADLSHLPASTVIARESAQAVQHETPQQIGRDLNVRYIVTGSASPEEDHVHIRASLIDTATAKQLWSTEFDPARSQISQVRPTIVHRIASPLNVAFNELESARSIRDRPNNPDALGLFFEARSLLEHSATLQDFQQADGMLRRAIEKQPDFTDAKAELGWALLREMTTLDDPDEATDMREAHRAIHEALAASPDNTKAMAAHALELQISNDCTAAEETAVRALELEPSSINARSVLAGCSQSRMQFDQAAAQYENILQLNPASPHNRIVHLILGTLDLMRDKVEDAVRELTLARDQEASAGTDMGPAEQSELLLVAALDLAGRQEDARADYATYTTRYQGRTVWRFGVYFDPDWRAMHGLQRTLNALHDVGMPFYADESETGAGDTQDCPAGAFAATPDVAPEGGRLITTAEFARAPAPGEKPPLVIDVGRGYVTEKAWITQSATLGEETKDAFALRVAGQQGAGGKSAAIVVLGDGTRGCTSFDAAKALIADGYSNVRWYRGGEEAWDKYRKTSGSQAKSDVPR